MTEETTTTPLLKHRFLSAFTAVKQRWAWFVLGRVTRGIDSRCHCNLPLT